VINTPPPSQVLNAFLGAPFANQLSKVQLLNAKPENVRTEAQVR
jgi:hypothetical protein